MESSVRPERAADFTSARPTRARVSTALRGSSSVRRACLDLKLQWRSAAAHRSGELRFLASGPSSEIRDDARETPRSGVPRASADRRTKTSPRLGCSGDLLEIVVRLAARLRGSRRVRTTSRGRSDAIRGSVERLELIGSAPALVTEAGTIADVGEVTPGDVLHFGFETAVLSRGLPPIGRLDPDDLVMPTYHGVAEEIPLRRLPYRLSAVEVLRWPSR